jgi:hypothetical protein
MANIGHMDSWAVRHPARGTAEAGHQDGAESPTSCSVLLGRSIHLTSLERYAFCPQDALRPRQLQRQRSGTHPQPMPACIRRARIPRLAESRPRDQEGAEGYPDCGPGDGWRRWWESRQHQTRLCVRRDPDAGAHRTRCRRLAAQDRPGTLPAGQPRQNQVKSRGGWCCRTRGGIGGSRTGHRTRTPRRRADPCTCPLRYRSLSSSTCTCHRHSCGGQPCSTRMCAGCATVVGRHTGPSRRPGRCRRSSRTFPPRICRSRTVD